MITTINRKRWAKGKSVARHLTGNGYKQDKHCCLGFDALRCGALREETDNAEMPSQLGSCDSRIQKWSQLVPVEDLDPEIQKFLRRGPSRHLLSYDTVDLEDLAVAINDSPTRREKVREDLLRKVFKLADRQLRFIN